MEIISVGLTFDSSCQSAPPTVEIVNDGRIIVPARRIETSTTVSFDLRLEPDHDHMLEIHRQGHDGATQQICNFQSFAVDELDISAIIDHGRYYPMYPEPWLSEQQQQGIDWPQYHRAWREWGWNGTWRLEYRAPFYTWLLQTI